MLKAPVACYTVHMQKTSTGSDRALESFKIFPYLAWGLMMGFAFMVYSITQKLEAVAEQLNAHAELYVEHDGTLPEKSQGTQKTTPAKI